MDNKKILKSTIPTIVLIVCIITSYNLISSIDTLVEYGLLTIAWVHAFSIVRGQPLGPKDSLRTTLWVAALLLSLHFFGLWMGFLGVLIVIIVLAGVRIYKGRKLYMDGMRNIEKKIWGQSLDKENWRKKQNEKEKTN